MRSKRGERQERIIFMGIIATCGLARKRRCFLPATLASHR
jgi:hypothetical protein